jgi:hypothetical protein
MISTKGLPDTGVDDKNYSTVYLTMLLMIRNLDLYLPYIVVDDYCLFDTGVDKCKGLPVAAVADEDPGPSWTYYCC